MKKKPIIPIAPILPTVIYGLIVIMVSGCSWSLPSWPAWLSFNSDPPPTVQITPGEKEFVEGRYSEALPLLTMGREKADLRAIFMERIILQYGLDGRPPRPAEANRNLTYLSLKFTEMQNIVNTKAPNIALYKTALAHLYYLKMTPSKEQDIKQALELAREAASDGYTPAMNLIAAIAQDPNYPTILWGLWNDGPEESFKWTLKAAEAGDILAMGNLSCLYRLGYGVKKDMMRATSWAHAAVQKTPPSARSLNDLGFFYEDGQALTQDLTEAARWYKMSAARNYQPAKNNLERLKKKSAGQPDIANTIDY